MAYRLRKPFAAFRIADGRRPVFDASGAALFGGRWNSAGRRVIYAAETYSGALLERLIHSNIGRVPKHHVWVRIEIPAGVRVEEIREEELPGWADADESASRRFGDQWYDEGRSAVLLVPSVVSRVERNVVINEAHPEFGEISAQVPRSVVWDKRLFGGMENRERNR
jgi:RES domain-containing protein